MAEYETTRTDAAGRPVVERTVVREPVVVERRGGGLGWVVALLILAALVWAAFHFGLVGVDKGSLPTVNVSTTGGEAPKVNTGRIDVGSKEQTVEVPTVGVTKAEDAKK